MSKVCVSGASDITIDYKRKTLTAGKTELKELDDLSIDGTTGEVFVGFVPTAPSEINQVLDNQLKPEQSETFQLFSQVMKWADQIRKVKIRANCDTPDQAAQAVAFGAEGIGLCRTEHMFFEG